MNIWLLAACDRSRRSARVLCNVGLPYRPRIHQRRSFPHFRHPVTSPARNRRTKSVHKRQGFAVDSYNLISRGDGSGRCTAVPINGRRGGHLASIGRGGPPVDLVGMSHRRDADFRYRPAGWHAYLFGWGTEPITDEAAEVGELPETASEDQKIFWYQYAPAAICTGIPVLLFATSPAWLRTICSAAATFARQQAMLHLVYSDTLLPVPSPEWFEAFRDSALRGALALLLAVPLACTSVFRSRIKRTLRIGALLESGFRPLRILQSGHPGDYVLWLTIGLASIGVANFLFLHR